jgi:hypothetical protein
VVNGTSDYQSDFSKFQLLNGSTFFRENLNW